MITIPEQKKFINGFSISRRKLSKLLDAPPVSPKIEAAIDMMIDYVDLDTYGLAAGRNEKDKETTLVIVVDEDDDDEKLRQTLSSTMEDFNIQKMMESSLEGPDVCERVDL